MCFSKQLMKKLFDNLTVSSGTRETGDIYFSWIWPFEWVRWDLKWVTLTGTNNQNAYHCSNMYLIFALSYFFRFNFQEDLKSFFKLWDNLCIFKDSHFREQAQVQNVFCCFLKVLFTTLIKKVSLNTNS